MPAAKHQQLPFSGAEIEDAGRGREARDLDAQGAGRKARCISRKFFLLRKAELLGIEISAAHVRIFAIERRAGAGEPHQ